MADLSVRHTPGALPQRRQSWDPFQQMQELMGLDPLEEFGRLLSGRAEGARFLPAFEVKETKDAFLFKADLPGVDEKDLDITVTEDRITVSGKRESEQREEGERYYAVERQYGAFSRAFTLPEGVNADGVQAELKDGVLSLRLPKRPESQPRRISVSKGGGGAKDKAHA
ncbi:Hsp20/alpha crystallin family protein [Aggregicoccus sp. 17bor-14]|uniref:Hsp20/alpha crystallin family protein n=1 Tax=Myxococcaceae TaxID=31 RepID=UPI00129C39AF|nr:MULTISPECIES: Hsp20/alpha crystallin family protein [Myxococcaceae]MBF5044316.1 Hsp20/alpha crystallin family protein [Simulacricoccus sp. 17bor-14]MRI90065.1 Hsp20/alpha crystallin family protein [Aggregicoccus sp. 17bor-14]